MLFNRFRFFFVGKFKKDRKRKKKKKDHSSSRENVQLMEKSKAADEDEVYEILSGDEDCSKGMKSMKPVTFL